MKLTTIQEMKVFFFASQGVKRSWKMRCDKRSQRYTTQWGELAKAY